MENRKEDVEHIRKQLETALKDNKGGEGSEDLKNMLEALKVLEEQPEIREEWSAKDERLYQSRDKPRVAHKPSYTTMNTPSSVSPLASQAAKDVEKQKDEPVRVRETVEWKGVQERNFVPKKKWNKMPFMQLHFCAKQVQEQMTSMHLGFSIAIGKRPQI